MDTKKLNDSGDAKSAKKVRNAAYKVWKDARDGKKSKATIASAERAYRAAIEAYKAAQGTETAADEAPARKLAKRVDANGAPQAAPRDQPRIKFGGLDMSFAEARELIAVAEQLKAAMG